MALSYDQQRSETGDKEENCYKSITFGLLLLKRKAIFSIFERKNADFYELASILWTALWIRLWKMWITDFLGDADVERLQKRYNIGEILAKSDRRRYNDSSIKCFVWNAYQNVFWREDKRGQVNITAM